MFTSLFFNVILLRKCLKLRKIVVTENCLSFTKKSAYELKQTFIEWSIGLTDALLKIVIKNMCDFLFFTKMCGMKLIDLLVYVDN